jgi:hypothetical protein
MADPNPNLGDLIKSLLLHHFGTCIGCRRPYADSSDADGWTIKHFLMIACALKCPDCQSPEERAECAVEQAIGPKYKLEGLRLVEDPKPVDGPEDGSQAQAS